jgi:hypothetical protein
LRCSPTTGQSRHCRWIFGFSVLGQPVDALHGAQFVALLSFVDLRETQSEVEVTKALDVAKNTCAQLIRDALSPIMRYVSKLNFTDSNSLASSMLAGSRRFPDAGARSPRRWPWARLLHRVFAIEVLVCDRCGGPRRILGAVTDPPAVRRVLVALGLAGNPPPGRPVPAA